MYKFKRQISLLLALVMVFAFVACGKQTEEKPKNTKETTNEATQGKDDKKQFAGKTLKVAGLEGGYGLEGWNKVIAKFQEITGAKVEAKFAKNIADEVRPQIQSGNAPDVNYISLNQKEALTETMIKEKAILDITDVLSMKVPGEEKTVKEKMIDGFTDTFTTNPYGDGKTYLMPIFYGPTGLFYNKSLFKDGGGSLELPKSVDDLAALKGKVEGAAVFTYPTAGYFDQVIYSLINSVGGKDLFNKLMSYDSKAWETEAKPVFEAAAKMISDLNKNTVAQANNESYKQNQLSVMKNESLFMPNGNWVVGEMKDAESQKAKGFEWGFMAIPSAKKGGDQYAYTFTEQVWVAKTTKEPELAKAFVAFLYSDEATKLFIENGGAVQPIKGAVNMIKDPEKKLFFSIYEGGVKPALGGFAAAPAVEGVNMQNVLVETVNSVANGQKTVDQWHKEVVEAVKKIEEAIKKQ